jgi:hypothetical protein
VIPCRSRGNRHPVELNLATLVDRGYYLSSSCSFLPPTNHAITRTTSVSTRTADSIVLLPYPTMQRVGFRACCDVTQRTLPPPPPPPPPPPSSQTSTEANNGGASSSMHSYDAHMQTLEAMGVRTPLCMPLHYLPDEFAPHWLLAHSVSEIPSPLFALSPATPLLLPSPLARGRGRGEEVGGGGKVVGTCMDPRTCAG